MSRIPLGERTMCKSSVNIPARVERYGFPREGRVEVEYDAEEHAVVYTPIEDGE